MALMVNELLQRLTYKKKSEFKDDGAAIVLKTEHKFFGGDNNGTNSEEDYEYRKDYFIGMNRRIDIGGHNVMINFTEHWLEKIYERTVSNENFNSNDDVVDQLEAVKFMHDCFVGNITKQKLDKQRNIEVNSLDMMQNTTIVYNMEVVILFQILFLISSLIFNKMQEDLDAQRGLKIEIKPEHHPIWPEHISVMLIVIHCISYVIHEYSIHEINEKGQPDIMGVYRAPNDVVLKTIELLLICLATGFTLMHIIDGYYQKNIQFILVLCQIIDIMIMFGMKPYIYLGQFIQQNTEIQKNMTTLYFVQRQYFLK